MFMTLHKAGGLFVLQSSVFRNSKKLLNEKQSHALTTKRLPAKSKLSM